jgi:hypothetical protein
MLSAADQYAISRGIVPTGGPIFREVAQAYAAGFIARPARHSFPLAGDQQFKRLLGQYLAENITVYHPATGRYGLLKGLPYCAQHDGEPLADVEFYADAEARAEGGGDRVEPYGKLLPVLYAFEDLATELVLADGRRVVPAVEVMIMMGWERHPVLQARLVAPGQIEFYDGDSPEGILTPTKLASCHREVDAKLREWGFAVGLVPHQYHRRVAGFDYASGGRPEKCAGCAGKEVCRG